MAGAHIDITADDRKLLESFQRSGKSLDEFLRQIEKGGSKIDESFDKASKAVSTVSDQIEIQKKVISDLERKYESAKAVFDSLNVGTSDPAIISQRKEASKLFHEVRTELSAEKQGLEDLEKEYGNASKELEKLTKQRETAANKQQTIITQIRQTKEEMAKLRGVDGIVSDEDIDLYEELKEKLSELGTAYRIVNQEQKDLTTAGSSQLAGMIQGITGLSGAFSAGQGVISLFVKDNEQLAAIQTKLQAAMAITIGLQQVSATLHVTSAFRINTVTKVTQLLATANAWLSTTLGISNVAAKALMATLTFGLSIAITSVISLINKYVTEQGKAEAATKKFNEALASSAASQIVEYEKLRIQWVAAGNDLKNKEKLVRDNIDAYNSFGIKINNVKDAENLFVNNADAFRESMMLRAKSIAAMELATEKYKEYLLAMEEAERRGIDRSLIEEISDGAEAIFNRFESFAKTVSSGKYVENLGEDYFAQQASYRAKSEAEKLSKESQTWFEKAFGYDEESRKKLKNAGGKLTNDIVEGSKNYWESVRSKQQKIMDENLPASDVFKTAKKQRDAAAKILEQWDKTNFKGEESAAQKAARQANAITEQSGKILEIEAKQSQERKRQNEDLENQAAQAAIDAMTNGAKKIAAQRELDNKLEIQALNRQKEDYIRAYIQAEKEKFDAQEDLKAKQNEKYIKKTFDPSTIKVDTSMFDAIIGDVTQAQLNQGFDAIDRSWNEYFLKFGNYQQKRAALIEKYNKEIETAQTGGEKAMLQKELDNQLDELDNSIKNSATLMGQLFSDTSKKSIQEIQAIIDKAELLLEYLQAVKDEQGNAVINGNNVSRNDILGLGISENTLKNLERSVEEVEALKKQFDTIRGDLGSRSPFKLLEKQIGDAIDKIKKGGKNNIAQGIGEISGAISQFAPQVKEFGNSLGTIFGDEKMGENIGLVVDGIEGIGTAAQGVGKIMSGDVVGGIMDVVNGAAKALDAFGSLFGPDGTAYYEGIKKQLEEINGIYDSIIEKSKEKITFGGGFASITAASDALDNYHKKVVNLQKIADASGRSGAKWNSHSAEWHSNKNVGTSGFAGMEAVANTYLASIGEAANLSIKSMDDLYYLSGDVLFEILRKMPEEWGQIDATIRENLESIIDCKDEAKELKDALNEALTGVSQDSFYNDFINNISDMSKSWEDMCDDFEKNLQKSIMAGLVASKYKSRIDALYQSWSDAANSDGNISAEEAERLRKEYQSIVEGMAKDRENLANVYGWDDTQATSATSKGIAAVSQDSFNEYLGTANATLNKAAEILNVSKDQLSNMISINNGVFDIQSIMRENQKIIQDSLNVQIQIERNTFKTAEILNKIDTLGVKSRD